MSGAGQTPVVTLAGRVQMPLVGLGTWQLRGQAGYDAVRYALAAGYRHIDTATMYGNEEQVGRAVRDSGVQRDQIFLTTKLPPENVGRERETLEASLRALGTDHVDLWLVHWPPPDRELVRTWREFLPIRDEGLARTVGVSNYDTRQLDLLIETTGEAPAVNQIPWSPAEHDPQRLAEHRARGVVLEGYSPLKRTRLDDPVLAAIASRHGVTAAQVVLRWHLVHGIPVIPKSGNPSRISSNLDLFGFTLDPAEIDQIDAISTA